MNRYSIHWPALFLAIFSLLLLSGCAGLSPSFEKPKVTLADLQIEEVNSLETAFLVQLRVMNPNNSPLTVEGVSCDLELDGRKFASGIKGSKETIPAYGSVLIPMEVYVSVLDMFTSIIGILQNVNHSEEELNGINYKLTGKVRINTGGFSRNLPFESEGNLNLQ